MLKAASCRCKIGQVIFMLSVCGGTRKYEAVNLHVLADGFRAERVIGE